MLIVAGFALSRLLFHVMGVRFDASGLDWYWQYLDVELLKGELLRSVFYQHSQPPLFNLFLGWVLKIFPNAYLVAFAFIFKGLSLALYFMLFRILSLVGFRQWAAYLCATVFMLMPSVVLYENWLFYTWPTAAMLVCAAHRLLLFEKQRRTRDGLLYIVAVAAVCLTRSMFHLIYLIPALLPVFWMASSARKQLCAAGGVAILAVVSLFLKNLLLFGFFGSSSWMGMNLWKIAPIGGKAEQLADSPVAHIAPFSPIAAYPAIFRQVPERFADIPTLADENRYNGKANLNHFGCIAVSDEYKRTAVKLIRGDLPGYAYMVARAWGVYFTPARSYPLLNRQNITALGGWFRLLKPADSRLLVPIGLILVLRGLYITKRRSQTPPVFFFLFCAGTVFYAAILGNLLEHGENMRFRVQTDPLLYAAALYVLRDLMRIRKGCAEKSPTHGLAVAP